MIRGKNRLRRAAPYRDVVAAVQAQQPEIALFAMLDALPLASVTSSVAIVLVVIFFVTSSDSGSLVIDTITAGGKLDAPVVQRAFWCTLEGIVAISLLLGGGLVALQAKQSCMRAGRAGRGERRGAPSRTPSAVMRS
jgi:choline-glycine betaine transporter